MRKHCFRYAGALMALALFASSCEQDQKEDLLDEETGTGGPVSMVTFKVEDPLPEEGDASTKATYNANGSFFFAADDTIGIFPATGSQVYFNIPQENVGQQRVGFDGGGWQLKESRSYWSYMPFVGGFYNEKTHMPVEYSDLTQVGNQNFNHISPLDFLYTEECIVHGGVLSFVYHRLNCWLRPRVTLPAGTYSKIVVSMDDKVFVKKGYYDLTAATPAIIGTEFTDKVTLYLQDITFTEPTQLVANIVIAPVDIRNTPIKVTVYSGDTPAYYYYCQKTAAFVPNTPYALPCTDLLSAFVTTAAEANTAFANGSNAVEFSVAPLENSSLELPQTSEKVSVVFPDESSSATVTLSYPAGASATPDSVYVKAPAGADVVLNTPSSTVTLGPGQYDVVDASTADHTLIIARGAYVQTLILNRGSLVVLGHVHDLDLTNLPAELVATTSIEIIGTVDNIISGEGVEVTYPSLLVDLGLSVKWASHNLGADVAEEEGDLFAWGETATKDEFTWGTYALCTNGASDALTAYNFLSDQGTYDPAMLLRLNDDAANALLGDDWRIPTDEEWQELYDNCTWTWTSSDGQDGFLVTSNVAGYEDASIFIPASSYWTSVMSKELYNPLYAMAASISNNAFSLGNESRISGLAVRAVSGAIVPATAVNGVSASLGLDPGETSQLTATLAPAGCTDKQIIWESSNPSVATVSKDGLVTAVASGRATVTARWSTSGDVAASCSVGVTYYSDPTIVNGVMNLAACYPARNFVAGNNAVLTTTYIRNADNQLDPVRFGSITVGSGNSLVLRADLHQAQWRGALHGEGVVNFEQVSQANMREGVILTDEEFSGEFHWTSGMAAMMLGGTGAPGAQGMPNGKLVFGYAGGVFGVYEPETVDYLVKIGEIQCANAYKYATLNGSGHGGGNTVNTIWEIGALNTDSYFSGRIKNGGINYSAALTGLRKVGTGTLTLTNSGSDYTLGTEINAGVLCVNVNTSSTAYVLGRGNVTVASGATLGGTGDIYAASLTSNGGILRPGIVPNLTDLLIINAPVLDWKGGYVDIDLMGTSCYDLLKIRTTADHNNMKNVVMRVYVGDNFQIGDEFPVLQTVSISNEAPLPTPQFSAIIVDGMAPGVTRIPTFDLDYLNQTGILKVVGPSIVNGTVTLSASTPLVDYIAGLNGILDGQYAEVVDGKHQPLVFKTISVPAGETLTMRSSVHYVQWRGSLRGEGVVNFEQVSPAYYYEGITLTDEFFGGTFRWTAARTQMFLGGTNTAGAQGMPNGKFEFGSAGKLFGGFYLDTEDVLVKIGEIQCADAYRNASLCSSGYNNKNTVNTIWEIGALNTDSYFSGSITGGDMLLSRGGLTGLRKVGTGTLTLTNSNSDYTLGTEINAGSLYVNVDTTSTTTGLGRGSVTVADGATLGGTGYIYTTSLSSYNGTISPGPAPNATGSMVIYTLDLDWQRGYMEFDLVSTSDYDHLTVCPINVTNNFRGIRMRVNVNGNFQVGDEFPVIKMEHPTNYVQFPQFYRELDLDINFGPGVTVKPTFDLKYLNRTGILKVISVTNR